MPLKKSPKGRRNFLFWSLIFAMGYPLLRFIGFKLPRKPVKTKVTDPMPPLSGVLTQKDFVLFDRNGKTWALSRRCTHLGCSISYHETGDYLECPCHQSRFRASDGTVIKGPATRPLKNYPVEKSGKSSGYVVTIEN